jgi:hypothetical protein
MFKEMEPSVTHLGQLMPGIEFYQRPTLRMSYKDMLCEIEGLHPGLGTINFQDYGYALGIARKLASTYDNLVFITQDTNPITNSILHEDAVIDRVPEWSHYYSLSSRPTEINAAHRLVDMAKEAFLEVHAVFGKVTDIIDTKDIIYQCLFRLFSFSPQDYIVKGHVATREWGGIRYHEAETEKIVFNDEIIHYIYFEQRANLLSQYYNPEAKLFKDLSNIFDKSRERGNLKVVKGVPYLALEDKQIKITIREVEPELARRIHRSFHYIHTPRNNGYALGMYLEGNKLPFSVLAIEKVDREYKKSALEKYNLSFKHTYEITRLYSAPHVPRNNSSFILSLASSYLRTVDKSWQATLSSFMPSYATGASMLSGGFEQMLFVKPLQHFYEAAPFGFVARTNRTSDSLMRTANRTDLMPVVELLHTRSRVFDVVKQDKLLVLKQGIVL